MLREELKEHQDATDCSDEDMIRILCDYLQNEQTDFNDEHLIEYVVGRLERVPGDVA